VVSKEFSMVQRLSVRAVALVGLVVALSACGQKAERVAQPGGQADLSPDVSVPAPVTPGGDVVDVAPGVDPASVQGADGLGSATDVNIVDKGLTYTASFDPALAAFDPRLDAIVRAESDRDLAGARAEAEAAYADAGGAGAGGTHVLEIQWTASAVAGDLISVEKSGYTYAGGAHPNAFIDARLFDRRSGQFRPVSALFQSDALMRERLAKLARPKLAEEKLARIGGEGMSLQQIEAEVAEILTPEADIWQSVALLPSTEAGKFGGVVVHFNAYDVGSYAEGPYDVVIAQSELRDALTAQAASLFAGEPVTGEFE
jgi:hypothetical protein